MKLILTVFAFLFISASAFAQSNERKVIPTEGGKYVSCGHDHDGQPCGSWTFVPDEVTDVQASPAGPMGGCTPRPYRQLVAYDDALLTNYTHQQIVTLVMKGHKQFADALDSSGITNQVGTRVIGIIPVTIPTYTKLSDVLKWAKDPGDGKLDALHAIKNDSLDADHVVVISREGISGNDKGVNLQLTTLPGASNEDFVEILWKKNFGVVNFITFIPNFTVTFAHESGHGVGGGHENDTWSPTYARAYVNSVKQVNCLMKGATVTNFTYNRFSGPNSKIVKNGETITMCEDTAVHNNAKHITECLDRIWCATENHVTRVSIQPTTCGSGTLHAITNNADTFQWKVVSGDCSLGATTGKDVPYMANATATIQVIGWKQGKWYADTAYITIPAVEKSTVMASINSGDFYILPSGDSVSISGKYESILQNRNGCDSIVTTILNVITSTTDLNNVFWEINPNPTDSNIKLIGLNKSISFSVFNSKGENLKLVSTDFEIETKYLSPGIYFVCGSNNSIMDCKKFIKL
ncbi:MAG: hypothetical protein JPMHGGIA_02833 [Saprospiraceae bacterium]|nr:hypothetical protein [Saprospiraceae bacterium]